MAGGGAPTPSKGGKKSVDFTVNLVPTLDLLSVLISFLLITAVWTQLARISTDTAVQKSMEKPRQDKEKEKKINILLGVDEMKANLTGQELKIIKKSDYPDEAKQFDELRRTLEDFKKKAGDTKPPVILASEDNIPYRNLIKAMDLCLDVGLTGISVGDPEAVTGELL